MASTIPSTKIKSVAVIGAGPGGMAATKYLIAEKSFSKIQVFEQRSSVGGVWAATPTETEDSNFTIPRTKPSSVTNKPVWTGSEEKPRFQFVSPVYDMLDTNIPHFLMNYSDQGFPKGSSLFPHHTVVKEYLEQYAHDIRPFIKLGVQVIAVKAATNDRDTKWIIKTQDILSQQETLETYDAVVVANGHYDDPYVPEIKGIKEWESAYPGTISHSKYYRRPGQYRDKKVIIVGNSTSGIDLSAQISTVARQPVLISEKSATALTLNNNSKTQNVQEIEEFIIKDRTVRFKNGHVEKHVEAVVFCTGYMYSFPFLQSLEPAVSSTGDRAQKLYQQIFYHPKPTLSFIGLPQRIVPFPVSEAQGAVIARILSGRLVLPSSGDMKSWEDNLIAERGEGKTYHLMPYPLDASYINFLHDWALEAPRKEGLENEGDGKIPPYWGEEKQWIRERFPLIKIASRKLGSQRHKVQTLKELGFDFEEWKRGTAELIPLP